MKFSCIPPLDLSWEKRGMVWEKNKKVLQENMMNITKC
jgi:hypothetical protein